MLNPGGDNRIGEVAQRGERRVAKTRPAELQAGVLWSDPAGGVVIGLTTGGRVAVITGSRIVPLNRPASVLAGNADAGTW